MPVSGIGAVMNSVLYEQTAAVRTRNESENKVSANDGDRLSLSLSTNVLTPDVEPSSPGTVSLGDIGTQIEIDRERLDSRLQAFMESLGIDRDTSFSLTTTRTGRISVSGDFDGREKLEKALNEDREFNNTFKRLSANSSLMEAAKRSEEFRMAYEIDPKAAVARYAYLLDDSTEYHFSYMYENGTGSTKVTVVTRGGYSV